MHLDRPVIFYRPNHAEYIRQVKSLLSGRDYYDAGDVVTNSNALIEAAGRALIQDSFGRKRQALLHRLFNHRDGESSTRVADLIFRHRESPQLYPDS